jgi:cystathionine beta-lyase
MPYDFDTLPNRRGTDCAKWNYVEADELPMWVADMDFRSPEPVIEVLKKRVEHGVFGYPSFDNTEHKQAVVDWVADRHGWLITPDDVLFLSGVVEGFNIAAHALARPDGAVIYHTPAYGPFLEVAKHAGIAQQGVELTREADGSYSIDLAAFEAAITPQPRLFILCNPHNPTGRVFRRDELEALAEICLRHNVAICSDEIHSDLVYSGHKHIPIALLDAEVARKTITLLAPSKTFNLAGLQASVAIIQDEELRAQFKSGYQGLVHWVNIMGMESLAAAYREGKPWLEALLEYLEANRDYTYDFVQTDLPGVSMVKPEGTYLAWLDCRALEIAGKPSDFFKERAKVVMNAGDWFGAGGEGFVRLNFGTPRSMLQEALEKMKAALESL